MLKFTSIFVLFILVSGSCQQSQKQPDNQVKHVDPAPIKQNLSYAELSHKVGGKWLEGKYEYQGGEFKNVSALGLPSKHTDHSLFIRYEGPGWESDKVGYRIYLDGRNAIDIFGKKSKDRALHKVGLEDFETYHHMSDWGMDILKVGPSLGIGAIGRFVDGAIVHFKNVDSTYCKAENSPKESSIFIDHFGWDVKGAKTDLHSQLTIKPNERQTRYTFSSTKAVEGICTGIVKAKDIPLIKKVGASKKWACIATYGVQSLVPDKLGMAILYRMDDVQSQIDTKYDHAVIFKPSTKEVHYYLLGAWEQEPEGIKSKAAFEKYLDDLLRQMEKEG